ncbi:glycosyltransferase family 4 protein [Pseudoroseomonas cervicalis]|uniref:glycosyltransferase family 4 protein n=1 Tax=Teichococcus cervicalis TaxID=204525 RepID=UPI0022F1BC0E|nr:glycosyltransferase family 4 protein [Pseudoroseomonas cervicalis]WBV44512.1 glycosyltransferase family 4 protein [Pseudoroseomonas cervicalis]
MTPPPNAAIGFAADGYRTDRPKLMGRHVAGEGFLRGMIRHSGVETLSAYLLAPGDGRAFATLARQHGAAMALEAIAPQRLDRLAAIGTLMLPGPDLASAARLRRFAGDAAWSVVGVTHTIASHNAMAAIAEMAAAPVQRWDALICTSRAVQDSVRRLLAMEAEVLARRLGARQVPLPELPVIPLGVECDSLAPRPELRGEWRARLGIPEGAVAVLGLGRLSWHAKAHPAALFAALGRAARREGTPPLHAVLGGWFAHPGQEEAHRALAAALAPEVTLHIADARPPGAREGLLAAADIFALLADNIQESFGLAPVEAMAAGLPVVVSDWDGFRDTVRQGEDGFRVPVRMAPPGSAADLALRHASGVVDYDHYLAATTQLVAVEIGPAADALAALAGDAGLRARMGAAGRARARAVFDWSVVIGQYQALWAELAARRAGAPAAPGPEARHADPTLLFAGYPTGPLRAGMVLEADPAAPGEVAPIAALPAGLHAGAGGLDAPGLEALLQSLRRDGPLPVEALLPEGAARRASLRGLVWLLKLGFVRIAN